MPGPRKARPRAGEKELISFWKVKGISRVHLELDCSSVLRVDPRIRLKNHLCDGIERHVCRQRQCKKRRLRSQFELPVFHGGFAVDIAESHDFRDEPLSFGRCLPVGVAQHLQALFLRFWRPGLADWYWSCRLALAPMRIWHDFLPLLVFNSFRAYLGSCPASNEANSIAENKPIVKMSQV